MLLVVTLLLIYLADLVASIREDGGDIGLLGFSVQSLLPSEVVQPRLREDTGGEIEGWRNPFCYRLVS